MSPRRKNFESIMGEEAADFDYGHSAVWFGWKCSCCHELAYDGTHLELQFFAFENCVYHDAGTLSGSDAMTALNVFTLVVLILI